MGAPGAPLAGSSRPAEAAPGGGAAGRDVTFVPLAFPSRSGVDALAMVIAFSARIRAERLGAAGMEAISRVMGLIMVCVGVQFVADGVTALAVAAR